MDTHEHPWAPMQKCLIFMGGYGWPWVRDESSLCWLYHCLQNHCPPLLSTYCSLLMIRLWVFNSNSFHWWLWVLISDHVWSWLYMGDFTCFVYFPQGLNIALLLTTWCWLDLAGVISVIGVHGCSWYYGHLWAHIPINTHTIGAHDHLWLPIDTDEAS